jgi:hypothetical protein
MIVGTILLGMTGCQCCGESPRSACNPTKSATLTTVIQRDGAVEPALPPVGEITVVRNSRCPNTKTVIVKVCPSDDNFYNANDRSFERPWPWGPRSNVSCD